MTDNTTVSIITITQLSRCKCLQILKDIIKSQTYSNIIEWVIVEGSKIEKDAIINSKIIKKIKLNFPIIYIPWSQGRKLGELRNVGNNKCKGDITICMDDDDYYPINRVSSAVTALNKNSINANIIGCSNILIYDFFLEKLYKFKELMPFHSTNNAMAWKKEHLLTNSHDPTKELAEEASFTKLFTEPMIQMKSEDTIVLLSHSANTFNKREILVSCTIGINKMLDEVPLLEPITNYIKEPFFSRYKQIYYKKTKSKYDIVYVAGCFSIKWNPLDLSLRGSEQAIINLVNNWSKMGKTVAVYGEFEDINCNGVDYINWKKFPYEHTYKLVILWRLYGMWSILPFPIKADQIWLDVHDNFLTHNGLMEYLKKYENQINKIFFKSEFQKNQFNEQYQINKFDGTNKSTQLINSNLSITKPNKQLIEKYVVIPNGIRSNFLIDSNIQKNPYRFVYCSCYARGLMELLQYTWPVIYKNEPRAELHVYTGMYLIKDEKFKNMMLQLLSQQGVMDHGSQPMDIIIREKQMSSFHLYITDTLIETDCISIRESLATGAIPLISNIGIFKERDGIHFDLETKNSTVYNNIGIQILQLMKQTNLNEYREQFKKSKLLINWEEIGNQWINILEGH